MSRLVATLAAATTAAALAAVALAALGALAATPAAAQEAPALDIEVSLDAPAVTLGERVRLTVTVHHDDDVLITASEPRPARGLRLIETAPAVIDRADGKVVTTFEYTLAGFALGELRPGTVRLSWLRLDGTAGSVEAAAPAFTVGSTVTPGDSELRPLKPQAGIAGAPPPWQRPVVDGGALALLALVAAWLLFVHRRRRPPPIVAQAEVEPPEDAARAQLAELAAAGLTGNDGFDHYYGTISTVVRGYLTERFDFRATAMTTTELQARMVDRGVERWQARLVAGLLDRCDAAVYARDRPDPLSADHDLTVAYEIIELSRPATPAAAS